MKRRTNKAKFIPTKKLTELVQNEGVGIDGDDTWATKYDELLDAYIERMSKLDGEAIASVAKDWDAYEEWLNSEGVPPVPCEALL